MKRRRFAIWCVAIGVLGSCAVLVSVYWLHARPHHRWVKINYGDPMPRFDAYLTWRDYDGWDYDKDIRGEVLLVWNGVEVGRGRSAEHEVVRRLKKLPLGSRVLIYPRYELEEAPCETRIYPLPIYGGPDFNHAINNRGLTLIFSPYDHLGRLCPEAYDGVHPLPPRPESTRHATSTAPEP